MPEVDHHEAPQLSRPHHEDSRFRYCTNFIVSGSGLDRRDFLPRLEGLGDSVLVVGDEATLKVHVHTDEPEAAVALFEDAGEVTNLDVADMREQIAERRARLERGPHRRPRGGRRRGPRAALRRARRPRRPRRRDAQPLDLRAARRHPRGPGRGSPRPAQLLERDHGRRARLRALREAGPGGPLDLAAGQPAGPGRARPRRRRPSENAERLERGARRDRRRRRRPGRPRRCPGPLPQGRRGRLRRRRDRRLGRRRLDPGGDDRAARRGGRDRHRDRRRGRADPARRARRRTSPTGSRSRPTTAASRAGGGCSPRSSRCAPSPATPS